MQTIVYQCDTAMPAQKLPNCCYVITRIIVGCKCRYYFGSYQQPIMVVNYF